ncbi:MAG: carbohydrate kinase family protein [bacterium]
MKNKSRTLDVVVAGHLCLDIIPKFPKLNAKTMGDIFVPGTIVKVGDAAISTGGPVSNTGLALKKLGLQVALIGKVADDFFGKTILDLLKAAGVDKGINCVPSQNEATSYAIVISPSGFDRMFIHNPGTSNTFGYSDIEFKLVEQAKLFHLGYPQSMRKLYINHGRELIKIFKRVKRLGVTTSLDMSLADPKSESGKADWNRILKHTLPYVDIFLPSVEEMLFMLDQKLYFRLKEIRDGKSILDGIPVERYAWMAEKCLAYGAKIVGLKCGHKGIYLRTADKKSLSKLGIAQPKNLDNWANRELWEPSYAVGQIASATGSGDSAIAGFIAAYLRGKSVEESLRYACAVGALNLDAFDAVSSIRTWQETTRKIQSNWKKNRLRIKASGWMYDQQYQLWHGPNDKSF